MLVNGLPGAGKTTLAAGLSRELGWPVLCKDSIKEQLFDSLGWGDREHSRRFGRAAMDILWTVLAAVPGEAIVESYFRPTDSAHLRAGLDRSGPRKVLEVLCECPPDVARDRFLSRIMAGTRHPGHGHDDPDAGAELRGDWGQLAPGPRGTGVGPVLPCDTTRAVDVPAVAAWVRGHTG